MVHAVTLAALADLTEGQWGLFTRRQAEATGMAWSTLSRLARDGVAERVTHGVYRLRGGVIADHLPLKAAWLALSPDTPAWSRTPAQGVVSHRSAAALLGLGHLPADVHTFTLPVRRQTRKPEVRLHRGTPESRVFDGLPVTRPARTAADLLAAREDPTAIAHIVVDAFRKFHENPAMVARNIAPHAGNFGKRKNSGVALLEWLLDLSGAPERDEWLAMT